MRKPSSHLNTIICLGRFKIVGSTCFYIQFNKPFQPVQQYQYQHEEIYYLARWHNFVDYLIKHIIMKFDIKIYKLSWYPIRQRTKYKRVLDRLILTQNKYVGFLNCFDDAIVLSKWYLIESQWYREVMLSYFHLYQ